MTVTPAGDTWRKSSYSGGQTNCVEIALAPEAARLRDTKAREHGHLELPTEAWRSLLDRV